MTLARLRQIADRLADPADRAFLADLADDLTEGVPAMQALGEDAASRRIRRDKLLSEAVALLSPPSVSDGVRALQAAKARLLRARTHDDLLRLVAAADAAYPLPGPRRLFAIVRAAIANDIGEN